MRTSWIISIAAAGALASACATTPEAPKTPTFAATLAPGAGITSTGKGAGTFTYDPSTHMLTYNVTYEGLSGPAAAAHIHGPAAPGANGPPVVPDLMAGKYYVNVHTAANRGGEIRGQIVAK